MSLCWSLSPDSAPTPVWAFHRIRARRGRTVCTENLGIWSRGCLNKMWMKASSFGTRYLYNFGLWCCKMLYSLLLSEQFPLVWIDMVFSPFNYFHITFTLLRWISKSCRSCLRSGQQLEAITWVSYGFKIPWKWEWSPLRPLFSSFFMYNMIVYFSCRKTSIYGNHAKRE